MLVVRIPAIPHMAIRSGGEAGPPAGTRDADYVSRRPIRFLHYNAARNREPDRFDRGSTRTRREADMPKYLIQACYTTEGARGLAKDGGSKRVQVAKAAVESVG